MAKKPTYKELEQRVKELDEEAVKRKQAEEALRESEERFRLLYERAPLGYQSLDEHGHLLEVNQAWLDTLRYTREEVIGKSFADFLHPDWVDHFKQNFSRFKAVGETTGVEFAMMKKDGSLIMVAFNGKIGRDEKGDFKQTHCILQDITSQKKSEKALRKSEERYRELADSLPEIVFETDEKGSLTYANRNAFDYFGYTESDFDRGLNALQMISPADRDRAMENMQKVLNRGILGSVEYTALRKDGNTFPVLIHSKAFFRNNKPMGLRGIIIDLTDITRAEEALRDSEETLKSIFIAAPIGIGTVFDRVIKQANDRLCEMTGYAKDELIGQSARILYLTDEEFEYVGQEKYALIRDFGTGTVETKFQRKDGKVIDVLLSSTPVDRDDLLRGVTFTALDITKRKQIAEELRESEEKYRSMMESMKDPVYICSPDFRVEYMNQAMVQRVGRDATGENCFKALHDLDEKCPWCMHYKSQQGEYYESEIVSPKDNRSYHISNSPIVHGDGSISKMTVFRDTTDLKKLETQLRQAQKMEAMGTLAGGIAHDFNNVLMGIQGRTSLMLMNKDSSHPDFGYLSGIEDNVESAADLTRQLLGFARGGKYEVRPTDINELIKKQSRMFGRTKKEITIHGEYEKNPWSVAVDRGQIEQVLLNLYINAWQAMPAGGDIYLETENVTLDEDYVKPFSIEPGRYVKISVTDTGVGMDKETQERIFEPFFTTKEMGRGTGLGLASAYGIIKNHGGFINVHSEKGEGATFNIYLPASEKEIVEEKKPAGDTLRGSETVLFVDDEDMIIEIAEELFEQLGYKVLTARSGKEAIEIYKENKEQIDIVILDMVMPDMSGHDAYDRMKDINPKIKVLLSSGYSIKGRATEILDRGCNGFIQKPFKMKELSQKLREILDKK